MKIGFSIPIVVLILSSLFGFFIAIQVFENRSAITEDDYKNDVVKLLHNLKPIIEELRDLPGPEEINVEVITNDWAEDTWGRQYYGSKKREVEIEEQIYKLLFIIPEEKKLIKSYIESSGFTAGMLDNTLYVVKEYFNPKQEIAAEIIAHELIHAIQSENFESPELEFYDEKQAWSALIEGDAIFTARQFSMLRVKEDSLYIECLNSILPAIEQCKAHRLDSISCLKMFPYDYGEEFIDILFDYGGWETVNNAYYNSPVSTEQILHPKKYLNNELPENLESPMSLSEEWNLERADRMGEHFVFIMLANWLDDDQARLASEGWGGDKLEYFESGSDQLLIWYLRWDSIKDAEEFYESFNLLINKTGGTNIENNELNSIDVRVKSWKVNWINVTILLKDRDIILIESNNDGALFRVLDKALISLSA